MAESRGVAILVGAGDAIGAAVARRFAKGRVSAEFALAGAMPSKSQGLVGQLRAGGHNIHAFSVDARQEAEVQGIFARIEREFGPIEVCLYNAGSNVNKPLLETTEKLFFKAWELACYGGFLVGNARLPASCFRANAAPSSLQVPRPVCVAARGLRRFQQRSSDFRAVAQAMARELGPKNIHVVHLLIDAGVDSEAIHQRMKAQRGSRPATFPRIA